MPGQRGKRCNGAQNRKERHKGHRTEKTNTRAIKKHGFQIKYCNRAGTVLRVKELAHREESWRGALEDLSDMVEDESLALKIYKERQSVSSCTRGE